MWGCFLALIVIVILVYVLQFLGSLLLFCGPPLVILIAALFLTLRIPFERAVFKYILNTILALFFLLSGLIIWSMTMASPEQREFMGNAINFAITSPFTTPLGVIVVVLLLALLFSQTRTYAIKASCLLWVLIFAGILFGYATYIESLEVSESLSNLVFGLAITSLTLIPLVLLRWFEMWPVVICGALFGSFFVVIANSAYHPGVDDALGLLVTLGGGIVPALMANMILMNLIRNHYKNKPEVQSIRGNWARRLTRLAVSIIILGTSLLFCLAFYYIIVIEDYPEIPQEIVLANLPYILFTLIVVSLNWISLVTKRDDLPVTFSMLVITALAFGFIYFSEQTSDPIAKAFYFACGVEAIGGLLTIGLELYGGESVSRKFAVFAGVILLMALAAQIFNLDIPLYWALIAGFIGGFIEFMVLKQMERDSEEEPEKAKRDVEPLAA